MTETNRTLERIGVSVVAENQPGALHELTGAIAAHLGLPPMPVGTSFL